MQHLQIKYHSELCLQNKHTMKCVGMQNATQILKSDYPPSYAQLKDQTPLTERMSYTLKIKVLSRDEQKNQFVIEGTKVHLINALTDEYVTCSSTGDIKFDKKSNFSEEVNKHLYKASTWTVQFLKNQTKVLLAERQFITVYDDLCFKSVHSTYLTLKPTNLQLWASSQVDPSRSVWNLIKANVPYIPQWVFKRPAFGKFSKFTLNNQENTNPNQLIVKQRKLLKSFTPQLQQQYLIEDILDVMMGFDGVYIKKNKKFNQYIIEPHLEQPSCSMALKQLVDKILTLPTFYVRVQCFIETYGIQQGILCQALCGGLRRLVKQYMMMVVQFDEQSTKQGLTMQKLWYLIQPRIKVIESLANLVLQAEKYKGGQILTLLSKLLNENTDQQIIQIYTFLFSTVLEVYIQILAKWLYEGIIEDKYGEFMIMTEEKSLNKEWSYWEEKFLIREQMVPSIFAKQANQILVTGKYLNILKTCNKLADHPYRRQIYDNFLHLVALQNFSAPITRAYEWANSQMLELVFNQCKFNDVLKSIKGYFFLEYGDLFVHFMDAAEEDLSLLKKKSSSQSVKTKVFSQQKMQNLFELLVRTSSANNDPFKEQVNCRVEHTTIYDQVHRIKTLQSKFNEQKPFVKRDSKYVDFMTLDYKCQFPLTLIFNKKNMSKYQVIFRFLFWCKFLERQLNSLWLSLQFTKEITSPFYLPAYLLNQRMINFIKNFIYYLCYEVIEENWLTFMQNLNKVKTFEDIIDCQTNFLNKCLSESLLGNSRLLTIITSELGKSCENFAGLKTFFDDLNQGFVFESIPTNPKTGSAISQRKIYIKEMKKRTEQSFEKNNSRAAIKLFGDQFDDGMRKLLRQVYEMMGKQQNHLLNLVNRLDEEKFYNKRLFQENKDLQI